MLYESVRWGQDLEEAAGIVDSRFEAYPHRLKTLRDGTLVLAMPVIYPMWKPGTEKPVRIALNLNAVSETQMMVFTSRDDGRTWDGPVPIYPGSNVTETDFVELPEGDLLFINNSIYNMPGRQVLYRSGNTFIPGPFERANITHSRVPETVCLLENGYLVGAMRNEGYSWSDDLGLTWWPLEGAGSSLYQPFIRYLGNNRIACAGHRGEDDPVRALGKEGRYGDRQYVGLQTFTLDVERSVSRTNVVVNREFDLKSNRYLNSYTVLVESEGKPVSNKDVEVWYVERYTRDGGNPPAYDPWGKTPLEGRMKTGGSCSCPPPTPGESRASRYRGWTASRTSTTPFSSS